MIAVNGDKQLTVFIDIVYNSYKGISQRYIVRI